MSRTYFDISNCRPIASSRSPTISQKVLRAATILTDPYKPAAIIEQQIRRAAKLDAYRKAAEALAGVNITGDRAGRSLEPTLTVLPKLR